MRTFFFVARLSLEIVNAAQASGQDKVTRREIKSDGQEKSTRILISWQELKNQFLSFFVHR